LEYEVQKVTCSNCKHQRILSIPDAKKLIENFVCRVCHWGDGKVKIKKTFEVCGACGQTMYQRYCWCKNKNQMPYAKITIDPDHKWTKEGKSYEQKKREHEIEMGKLNRFTLKKQIDLEREPQRIQKEILSELQKLNNPKKEEVKTKKYIGQAIQ